MSFSLQNYTTYSALSGMFDPKLWVKRAVELGYPALGICDKSEMSGLVDFQEECLKEGIKPILGTEMVMCRELNREKLVTDGNILLFVKNETGYKNLVDLNNKSYSRQGDKESFFFHVARMNLEYLSSRTEGLICVIPECDGYGIDNKNNEVRVSYIMELSDLFGDDFYIGLEETESGNQTQVVRAMCESLKLKTVPTFNAHFPEQKWEYLHKIVRSIDKQRKVSNNRDRNAATCYMRPLEPNHNLQEIYDKCEYLIPTGQVHMPEPILRTGDVEKDLLARIGEGFKKKLVPTAKFDVLTSLDQLDEYGDELPYEHVKKGETDLKPISVYVDRLKHEWNIIKSLGFFEYFHIVDDVCRNADLLDLPRGPGRGSAAGSEFSYLLNITHVDSIRHGLFFERFLNPDRNDLPDIDLDFGQEARTAIVEWVAQRYGKDRVVFIGSYDRLKAASAVKYVAKVLGYSIPSDSGERVQYDDRVIDSLFKKADKHVPETIRGRAEIEYMVQEYEEIANFYAVHTQWFETHVFPLLDTITATSVHAAGVLILPESYATTVPIRSHSTKDLAITQYRDKYCEKLGFPKFDFLTVQAIDVIHNARKLILKHKDPNFPEIHEASLSDPDAIKIFNEIKTQGIFQHGSNPQQIFFRTLKPKSFEHLVASVALIRPGPMNMDIHTQYAEAMNNPDKIHYDHEDLKEHLGDTYGFIVYQEQMMSIATGLAGFTGSEADHLRKACGKKKPEEMAKWETKFKEQGLQRGYSQELLDHLWSVIVSFAEYSFNKSHSVAYTLISYYEGYIKAKYPIEFWCAVMNASKKSAAKGKDSIHSLKGSIERMGIEFVFPTVNGFSTEFSPAGDNKIYWPLSVLQGFGKTKVEYLDTIDVASFSSLEHMLEVVNTSIIGKTVVENMIRAGFFTPIEPQWVTARKYYLWRAQQEANKKKNPSPVEVYLEKENIPEDMLSEDPLQWAMSRNAAFGSTMESWKDVAPFHKKCRRYSKKQFESIPEGEACFIGGRVENIYYKQTKNGDWFAAMNIVDGDEKYSIKAWGSFWESHELDMKDKRPEKGDLVELIGHKNMWSPEPGKVLHSLTLSDPDQYVRIVNRHYVV